MQYLAFSPLGIYQVFVFLVTENDFPESQLYFSSGVIKNSDCVDVILNSYCLKEFLGWC